MITVKIDRNHQQEIIQYKITGHANAASYGEDIVCAAVSVLSQTTILGLHEIAEIETSYEVKSGYLTCQLPAVLKAEERQKANLLLETMVLGLKNLMVSYSDYITLHDKEV